jgi:hypothetical protein
LETILLQLEPVDLKQETEHNKVLMEQRVDQLLLSVLQQTVETAVDVQVILVEIMQISVGQVETEVLDQQDLEQVQEEMHLMDLQEALV